ncbi:MAG: hypothetical protein N2315_06195, partial [Thermanaerothrix sp.]|nr:hypothetical protein [Thermanaerothrix sp.]
MCIRDRVLHAAQAMDMRGASYGEGTSRALRALREDVPFMEEDRDLSVDMAKALMAVRTRKILHAARGGCA